MLPDGNYLTGFNLNAYIGPRSNATYYYCQASVDPGTAGSSWKMGPILATQQMYPQSFSVFALGNVSSSSMDIEGPLASGAAVTLSSLNLNWGQKQPIGLISAGYLNFTNGSVYGTIYRGAGRSLTNVNYTSMVQGVPLMFYSAATNLQQLSGVLSGYSVNGVTSVVSGNITLLGKDPNVNVFTVEPNDLGKTHSITINVPSSSTVIVNVPGKTVSLTSVGFSRGGLNSRSALELLSSDIAYDVVLGFPWVNIGA